MCQMHYDDPLMKPVLKEDTEELLFGTWRPHPTHPEAYVEVLWSVGLTSKRCTECNTGGSVVDCKHMEDR